MSNERVVVNAPATLSNLGSGFDVFGLALREPFDTVEARRIPEKEVVIERILGKGAASITTNSTRNSSGMAASAVLDRANADFGVSLIINKGIRPCSGIGSSGASAAGGAFATNLLLDSPLDLKEVVFCAAKAEQVTSGSFHADNVGPSVMGGFTLIKSYDPFEILRVEPPPNLGITIAMPDFMVNTKEARKVLPAKVDLKSLISQVGNASALVVGMMKGDVELVGGSMRDVVVEPARASLVPHLRAAEAAAIKNGAAGSFLGGSGPCIIAVFDSKRTDGGAIADAVREVYLSNGIECDAWVTSWGEGCRRVV